MLNYCRVCSRQCHCAHTHTSLYCAHFLPPVGCILAVGASKPDSMVTSPLPLPQIGQKRIHVVRVRGGNRKYRALRLDHGNFSWGSEAVTRKTRVLDVVYNATNNELVRTKTLVKNCIIQIDATPFRKWYETYYGLPIGKRRGQAKVGGVCEW